MYKFIFFELRLRIKNIELKMCMHEQHWTFKYSHFNDFKIMWHSNDF